MPDSVLYAPSRERVFATNAWAFLHWGRAQGRSHSSPLADWASLERWRDHDPAGFRAALHDFAQLGSGGQLLCRHAGPQEALVLRTANGGRMAWSRDTLRAAAMGLPPEVERSLATLHPPGQLLGPLALLLLYADLRPDDRLFVRGLPWPWLCALLQGTTVILDAGSADLLETAAAEKASVVAAPAAALTETAGLPAAAGRRRTPRIILAVGGPLAEATRRSLVRVNPDTMLLACAAGRIWGDPLSPVIAAPTPRPALLAWAP